MVEFFLSLGALVTETNDNGDTPLLLAAYCGHTELIQWLLDNGAKLSERNNTEMGPLISAANGGSVEAVQLLLKQIAKAGADCGDGIENTDQGGYTPLLLAAQRGHKSIVHLLATHGANLEAKTERHQQDAMALATVPVQEYLAQIAKMSPLQIAADAGDLDRVHSLVVEASTAELKLVQAAQAAALGKLADAASVVSPAASAAAGSLEDLTPVGLGLGLWAAAAAADGGGADGGGSLANSPAVSPGGSPRLPLGSAGRFVDSPSRSLRPAHRLIRQALKPWAPTRHCLFGITTRRQVFSLFLVHSKLQKMETLPHLPKEIWLEIASFFGRAADSEMAKEENPRRMAMHGYPIGLGQAKREAWRVAHNESLRLSRRTNTGTDTGTDSADGGGAPGGGGSKAGRDDSEVLGVQKRLIY